MSTGTKLLDHTVLIYIYLEIVCRKRHLFTIQRICFRANGGRVLVFENLKLFKTLPINRLQGIYGFAQKTTTSTSIQHTVLEPSYQGIHLVFSFPSTLLIKQETEDKSCWLSKVLFIESQLVLEQSQLIQQSWYTLTSIMFSCLVHLNLYTYYCSVTVIELTNKLRQRFKFALFRT